MNFLHFTQRLWDRTGRRRRKRLSECESPVERMFYQAAFDVLKKYDIIPQYPILRYRADFAIPEERIVIEIDGHNYHSSKKKVAADNKRDRHMLSLGWIVIRFSGSEVYRNPYDCANEVDAIIIGRRRLRTMTGSIHKGIWRK